MAVELTKTRENFVGTGALANYTPDIYANSSSQIKVYVDNVLQTIGDDYTLSGIGDAAGVSVSANFLLGSAVFIERVTPITQLVDTQNNETILEDVLDAEFDKLTMIAQEISGTLNTRALLVPNGETAPALDFGGAGEGDALVIKASGAVGLTDASLFAGKFYAGDAMGRMVPASGTGNDAALRADLAAANGDALIERNGSTLAAALDALDAVSGSPSEPDKAPLHLTVQPMRGFKQQLRELHRRPDRTAIDATCALAVGERINVWGQTEALASAHYSADSSTKQADTIVVDGITLTRLTCANFYSSLRSNVTGLGYTPFVAGQRYLISCYVLEVSAASAVQFANDDDKFVWMRTLAVSNSQAHGPKFIGNRLRRIWTLAHATTTALLDVGTSATVALGGGAGGQPYWLFSAQSGGENREIYIGGFQIENVGDAAYKDGIAGIGDSIMQGSSGNYDNCLAREWMGGLAAHLNVPTFNRAVGGERLDNMDARWAADITPLAVRCADVIIAGGVNDIVGGRTLGQMQASVNSMVAKAVTDGLRPIIATATPTVAIAANATYETLRNDFNTWIKRTFPHVLDIASVIEDPYIASKIRNDPDWTGDGTHFGRGAKRAVAAFCAQWPHWNRREPGPYQANPGNANTWTPPVAVLRGAAGQLIGQRKAGWATATGTATRTTFDTATVTLPQLAERMKALIDDLHATAGHGLIGA